MYRRFFCLFAALFALGWGTLTAKAEESTADFVRLHVVAESDSEEDQAIKLHVRDACVRYARETLKDCADAEEAYRTLRADRLEFERVARRAAREMGFSGAVTASVGVFDFPDRIYGDLFVPAGEYRALRVVLGEGEGHNWWCVLYPSLCVLDEAVYASGGEDIQIEFYSSLVQWMRSLWSA